MTEKCQLCISLGEAHLPDLLKQIERANEWADLIEIRLDKLFHFNVNSISMIEEIARCPIIWTLRKASQGGDFMGSEEERFQLLHSLVLKSKPAFIDLEADTPESIIHALQALSSKMQWIISWHDLSRTPEDLDILYQKVSRFPATYYKIATQAHSTTDAIRMLKLNQKINQHRSQLCGLCMGKIGQSTRILSPLVGQPFTFAALEKGKETASGQLTAEELILTYRFRELNRKTELLGLMGRPVDQSVSHLTHNAVLQEFSINAIYLKFLLEDWELPEFLSEMQSLPIKGFSVTTPFKEKVLTFLTNPHDLTACNTLVWNSKEWVGFNTDGIGALKALNLPSLQRYKMVILGAGGTAKAIAQAAYQQGAQLVILNRTLEKAKHLAIPLKAKWGLLEELPFFIQEGYHCVIQATSVGMAPAFEESPVSVNWSAKNVLVLDVISSPPQTRFLRDVKHQGGQIIAGRELFIQQAVEQFVCWFGPQISQKQVEKIIRERCQS